MLPMPFYHSRALEPLEHTADPEAVVKTLWRVAHFLSSFVD